MNLAGWQARSLVRRRCQQRAGVDRVNMIEVATVRDTMQHLVHLPRDFPEKTSNYSGVTLGQGHSAAKVLHSVTL